MSRFYISKESIEGNTITITGEEAHHILDVMRLKKLDKVVTFDGTGREYVGFIKDVKAKSLTIEVVQTRTPKTSRNVEVTLIQAIPKKERMDYIVEKSTELGVSLIIPIITARTIPSWDEFKKSAHVKRWRKMAREASKQCGRADVPAVFEIMNFKDAIKRQEDYDLRLIATLSEEAGRLKDILNGFKGEKISIAIGPEGDFTTDEVEEAKASGFKPVGLGPRVLKSDTAGLTVLAILNYELGH